MRQSCLADLSAVARLFRTLKREDLLVSPSGRTGVLAAAFVLFLSLSFATATEPLLTRVPEGGLQPQAVVDSAGITHLVYFKGDPKAGNLFYVKRARDEASFSKAVQVNSKRGDAIAIGTIRGVQIALGRNDRLHVAWNGSDTAKGHPGAPMYYTRMTDGTSGTGAEARFEPERDVITSTGGLDGGGSIAADRDARVFVIWHGQPHQGGTEADRKVFLALSTDEGDTFAPERAINPDLTGACGCCGLKSFVNRRGELFVLYRQAREGTDRDEVLLLSDDAGVSFREVLSHPWKATTCPMSSAWVAEAGPGQTVAAWETAGRVWFDFFGANAGPHRATEQAGMGQKFPMTATSKSGETLLVWVEGAGWEKGGDLVWETIDAKGNASGLSRKKDAVAAWTFAAPLVRKNGSFEIIY
jgi:hypothetical protein